MRGTIPQTGFHVGQKFGMLTVLAERTEDWVKYATCRCDCGKTLERKLTQIKRSPFPSCGCYSNKMRGETNSKVQFDPSKYLHKRFSRLLVTGVDFSPDRKFNKHKLVCRCDCGAQTLVTAGDLTRGETKSCGCLATESRVKAGQESLDHGHATFGVVDGLTPIYTCWLGIRALVANGWKRGSHLVCHEYDPRWEDFRAFYSDFGDISVTQTIRRKNRQLPWSKENCYITDGQRRKAYPANRIDGTSPPP